MPTQILWRSDPHDRQGVSDSHAHVASGYCQRHTLAGAFEFYRSKEAQKYVEKKPPYRFDTGTSASNAVDITNTLQYLLT